MATVVSSKPALFAVLSLSLQIAFSYKTYPRYLKWLTFVGLTYLAVLFVVEIDWPATLNGCVWPTFPLAGDSFTMIVTIFGRSAYLFFWRAKSVEN